MYKRGKRRDNAKEKFHRKYIMLCTGTFAQTLGNKALSLALFWDLSTGRTYEPGVARGHRGKGTHETEGSTEVSGARARRQVLGNVG